MACFLKPDVFIQIFAKISCKLNNKPHLLVLFWQKYL
jgi:hypothetical protein